jgi:hypothetical protein
LDQDVDTPDSSDPEGTSADHHAGRSTNRPRIEAKWWATAMLWRKTMRW